MKAVFIKVLRLFGLDALLARALEKLLQGLIKKTASFHKWLAQVLTRLQAMQKNYPLNTSP